MAAPLAMADESSSRLDRQTCSAVSTQLHRLGSMMPNKQGETTLAFLLDLTLLFDNGEWIRS
jgi:hypothetical protein